MQNQVMGFGQIQGRAPLVRRLQAAVKKVGHAYIFDGEAGMGKRALALAFAKALQCEGDSGEASDACGVCLSCRVFESGNHPDVLYVQATKTKSLGVDDVRSQIVLPMAEKPFRYRYKIFIIDQAETLTPAAQNALLKTIEEPASFGIFLFLAAGTRALLPTVLSRCVTLKLPPLPDALVAETLHQAGVPEAAGIAAFAKGNPGRALALAQSADFAEMRNLAQSVAQAAISNGLDTLAAFGLYTQFEKWRESIQTLLDILYACFHGQMLRHPQTTLPALAAITQTKRTLSQNGNFQMAVELLLLKLANVNPEVTWKS